MTSEPELDHVRSYLLFQTQAKTFEELQPLIEEPRAALMAEVEGLSEEQAHFKPAEAAGEETWCIAEVLRHCIHSEEGAALRIRALGLGDPARDASLGRVVGRANASVGDLVRDLKASRFALEHAAGSIAGKEKLEPVALHPLFGELNCRAWYLFQRLHDLDHLLQVQQIKASAGYPG
jgi:hypothetical protein